MKKIALNIFVLVIFQCSFSQKKDENIGSEVVNIVKPYTPTLSDAFKLKDVPTINEEMPEPKKAIQYSIFSFPVASTFIPSKGKAVDVEKEDLPKGFSNYAYLGFGNYATAQADVFLAHQISNSDYWGARLQHISSQGGIKEVVLDDKFMTTQGYFTYGSKSKNLSWNVDLNIKNQMINWYGLPTNNILFNQQQIDSIDSKQMYNTMGLSADVLMKDGFFNQAKVYFKRFSDDYKSGENRFFIQPDFNFEVDQLKFNALVTLDYVGGKWKNDSILLGKTNYTNLLAGIQPSLLYQQDDFSVSLGAGLFLANLKQDTVSDTNFYIYPNIKASYKLVGDLLIAYAGAVGGLQQNSYAQYVDKNPFVSPNLTILPTDNSFDVYGGLKGKIANSVAFDVKAALKNEKYKAFFVSNSYNSSLVSPLGFQYGNSFQVLYDNLNTFTVFGELKADISKKTTFGISGSFAAYSPSNFEKAWNLPQLNIESTFTTQFGPKWYGSAQVFFVGERYDWVTEEDRSAINPVYTNKIETLDSYFDLNLQLIYKYSPRWNFYLKGNNLANQQYNKWANFPVQGIQIVIGASYKFDF